jgi:hypothetical protein
MPRITQVHGGGGGGGVGGGGGYVRFRRTIIRSRRAVLIDVQPTDLLSAVARPHSHRRECPVAIAMEERKVVGREVRSYSPASHPG